MIVAIYIPKDFVEHTFEKDKGITLNFNGKNQYSFEETEGEIIVKSLPNPKYIDNDFWANGIERINAIVGKNGTGKTSLLRWISPSDSKFRKCIYVVEENGNTEIINYSGLEVKFNTTTKEKKNFDSNYHFFYYSPILSAELKNTRSSTTLVNYMNHTIEEYNIGALQRQIMLLHDIELVKTLKDNYKDFPHFDKITISIDDFRSDFFLNPYSETNIGTPDNESKTINTIIDPHIKRVEAGNKINAKSMLEDIKAGLKSKSLFHVFKEFWHLEQYRNTSRMNYLTEGLSLIKGYEKITISYLILDSTFPQVGLSGGNTNIDFLYDDNSSFKEKLSGFVGLFIDNYNGEWYKIALEEGDIDLQKIDRYIEIIEKSTIQDSYLVKNHRKGLIASLKRIKLIYKLYEKLKAKVSGVGKEISIDLEKDTDISFFNFILDKNKEILSAFNIPVNFRLFKFTPNKILSSGENSLLDLYASFYDMLSRYKNKTHMVGTKAMLLLDEAELGFHPAWKKKFVNAINSTFSLLFKKYNEDYKLQILFTTHDPLTLSDMPSENVIFLDKNKDNKTFISIGEKRTFGANIHDLLADSFFIEDGLVGDFVKEKINETIKWISKNKEISYEKIDKEKLEYHKQFIKLIDEKVLKLKLTEMITELERDDEYHNQMIDEEIKRLQNLKK